MNSINSKQPPPAPPLTGGGRVGVLRLKSNHTPAPLHVERRKKTLASLPYEGGDLGEVLKIFIR